MAAARMIEDKALSDPLERRYAGWSDHQDMLAWKTQPG